MAMIEKILASIKKLPAFPVTIQRVIELLRNDDYLVQEVAQVIKYDQAIAANVLKISNSAYLGTRQKIRTIPDAIVYLGQRQLIRAVQTAGVSRLFIKGAKSGDGKAKELWEHAVAVAVMSQILCRRLNRREDGALYTAALVHDIGKLIMVEYAPEASEKISRLVSGDGLSFLEAEEEILGINHAELGGRIAEHWNFPAELRDAIAYHHRPDLFDRAHQGDLPFFVFLADQLCLVMGIYGGMDGLAQSDVRKVMKKFGLEEDDLEKSRIVMAEEMEKAKDFMEIV
jgi:putative nucleotidyltransferase with HDIG domain